jgi:UDP-2,4-diacetamido-2,4,6-trideoxy-beta-L-altropyranose hydrolase
VFRLEASSALGAGHAMRCLVLAKKMLENNWKCYFSTTKESYLFVPQLNEYDRLEPDFIIKEPFKHTLHIVDHYGLDIAYEAQVRPLVDKILVLDDLGDREHDCDILLDQTYGRVMQTYIDRVPSGCNILVGSQYALIREEFVLLREKALLKRKDTKNIQSILVNMGGSDQNNNILVVLKHIHACSFFGEVDIVFGFTAPHIKEVLDYLNSGVSFKFYIHMKADMPKLIFEADLSIGAAGSSVWERACLGLPSIIILTAENQSFSYEKLIADKICFPLSELKMIIDHYNYNELCRESYRVSEGLGAKLVFDTIMIGNQSP